tara:strand:+ start:720 stop:1868 length:1149 start_codon:yes stop_codon:yes gene_type:complete
MKEHRRKVAEILNRSDIIAHVSMTGGGTSFIGEYLGFGGASSTLVGAEVPYHPSKVDEFLGNKPFDKYCSRGTARQMAAKSYFIAKGSEMNREESNPIGIGVTCSLTTGKGERVGRENKAFVCIHSGDHTSEFGIQFFGFLGGREVQEGHVVDYIFSAITTFTKESCNLMGAMDNPILKHLGRMQPSVKLDHDFCEKRPQTIKNALKRFKDVENIIVMSGSFNPFHEGHAEVFEKCKLFSYSLDGSVLMVEVTSSAQGKAPIDHLTIRDRVKNVMAQTGHVDVVYSDVPFFVDKYNEYSDGKTKVIFAIGYDIYERIRDFNYKEGTHEEFFKSRDLSPDEISFIVFPREDKNYEGDDPYVLEDSKGLEIRNLHISSTQIRNK